MNLQPYKELLDTAKEARIGQIILKLELQLFGLNSLTDKQKEALKEAEDNLLDLLK